jgi:hypothetical protein
LVFARLVFGGASFERVNWLGSQQRHRKGWRRLTRGAPACASCTTLQFILAHTLLSPPRDDIDAFVLQLEGSKRWRLYAPTDPEHVLPRCDDAGQGFFRGGRGGPLEQPRKASRRLACCSWTHPLPLQSPAWLLMALPAARSLLLQLLLTVTPAVVLPTGIAAATLRRGSWGSVCWKLCWSRATAFTCRAVQVRHVSAGCAMPSRSCNIRDGIWEGIVCRSGTGSGVRAGARKHSARCQAPMLVGWMVQVGMRSHLRAFPPPTLPPPPRPPTPACSAPSRVAARQPLPAPHPLRQPATLMGRWAAAAERCAPHACPSPSVAGPASPALLVPPHP